MGKAEWLLSVGISVAESTGGLSGPVFDSQQCHFALLPLKGIWTVIPLSHGPTNRVLPGCITRVRPAFRSHGVLCVCLFYHQRNRLVFSTLG